MNPAVLERVGDDGVVEEEECRVMKLSEVIEIALDISKTSTYDRSIDRSTYDRSTSDRSTGRDDSSVVDSRGRVALLKVDVEGAELKALQGKDPILLYPIHPLYPFYPMSIILPTPPSPPFYRNNARTVGASGSSSRRSYAFQYPRYNAAAHDASIRCNYLRYGRLYQ